jgi:medium-chain acyl-[acyl-carrier-protein] hydrolase
MVAGRCGPLLLCLEPRPAAGLRLYAFPCGGASAESYLPWLAHLPEWVEPHAVRLPGRGGHPDPLSITDPEALARQLADLVHSVEDERPFAFFGHSVGALLAWATAQALRAQGRDVPVVLGVSGCLPPHRTVYPQAFAPRLVSENPFRALGLMDVLPEDVASDPAVIAELAPPLLADILLVLQHRYRPAPPLDSRVVIFGGSQDRVAPAHELSGWAELARDADPVRIYPGGHMYLHSQVADVVDDLVQSLRAPFQTAALLRRER